jgi:hypothetical protein
MEPEGSLMTIFAFPKKEQIYDHFQLFQKSLESSVGFEGFSRQHKRIKSAQRLQRLITASL